MRPYVHVDFESGRSRVIVWGPVADEGDAWSVEHELPPGSNAIDWSRPTPYEGSTLCNGVRGVCYPIVDGSKVPSAERAWRQP